MYWFTNSYRKKEAKFRNDLLNKGKSEVSVSGLLLSRGLCEARAHGPQGRGYRLEAFSQSDIPSTTLDVGRRFVVVVFKITNDERCMSECWNRNALFPCRRLRPNYHRDASRYELAPIPCAFRPLYCYLLGTLT
jgi:hypothetical protein